MSDFLHPETIMAKVDIALVTVIPEEYQAVVECLKAGGCDLTHYHGSSSQPNQFAWVTGNLVDLKGQIFSVVVAMATLPGQTRMSDAITTTVTVFKPRYVLLVGIAGGFALDGLTKGDVVVSSAIHDYEYGKLANEFKPRPDFTSQLDISLLSSATALDVRDRSWSSENLSFRPGGDGPPPKLLKGPVASGNKVVDNARNEFFTQVMVAFPKLLAVEMEGAGAASAIDSAKARGLAVGFLMLRGISDMPHMSDTQGSPHGNTQERDEWKRYAASNAASFAIHWIRRAWPIKPATKRSRKTPRQPASPDGGEPPEQGPGSSDPKAVHFDPFSLANTSETSVWLGFRQAAQSALTGSLDLRWLPDEARLALKKALSVEGDPPHGPLTNALDAELESVKNTIERHELEIGEAKLKEIELRHPDRLQPSQWYQLRALRSRILTARWKWVEAGHELIEAKRLMPNVERARVNEALGYELIGNKSKAYSLATTLREEFPRSARLLTILIRTAPDSTPLDELLTAAEPFVNEDEEMNLSLGHRAMQAGQIPVAMRYAKRATEIDPTSPHAWFLLGQVNHTAGYSRGVGTQTSQLREAISHYDRAIGRAEAEKLSGLEAAIRIHRGKLRSLLGEPGAEYDYRRAVDLGRTDDEMRLEFVAFLVQVGRPVEALRELAEMKTAPSAERLFYEAASRHGRNVGDDRIKAKELLRQVISRGASDRWVDAHMLFVQWAVEEKAHAAGRELILAGGLRETNPLVFHTLDGWLSDSEGRSDEAREKFILACAAISGEDRADQVFLLAQGLGSVGELEAALPLLERCYHPGIFDLECKRLLDTARRLDRHDVIRRVCRDLRAAGVADARVIETEIGLEQLYDPELALRLAQERLATHPDDRPVALWQSVLAMRLGRKDLLISDVSRLPGYKDVTPEGSSLVVGALSEGGEYKAALNYAYDALRAHFGSEYSHGLYFASFQRLARHCPELRIGGTAGPGMAVRYREEHDEADRWLVIENGPDPKLSEGEYAPDHPLSLALTGKRGGETVVVPESGLQDRRLTIRETMHKCIYRFRDCAHNYQVRFPGGSAIQMIHVGSGDTFDPSAVVEGLEQRASHIKKLEDGYRTQTLPFSTFADLAGRNEIDTWAHMVSDPSLGIRCASGEQGELREALAAAKSSTTFVFEVLALVTLARLDVLASLPLAGRKLVVSRTTFDKIESFVDDAEADSDASGTTYLTARGGLGIAPTADEMRQARLRFATALRDQVREHFEILPCPQAADLNPTQRTRLIDVVGRHNLDASLLATSAESALWTDDLLLGIVCQTTFQTRRVWTQAGLSTLRHPQHFPDRLYHRAIAKLAGWHYHNILLDEETLFAAAELSDWQMDRWPAPPVLRVLGAEATSATERLRVLSDAIRLVWRRHLVEHERRGFLFAALANLRSRPLVTRLYQRVPAVFTVDVQSSDEVQDCIAAWLKHPTDRGLLL